MGIINLPPSEVLQPPHGVITGGNVTPGEGWLQELHSMGFSNDQAEAALPHLLSSEDPGIKEWVYRMADGEPGISQPGQIPTDVLESIMKLRS